MTVQELRAKIRQWSEANFPEQVARSDALQQAAEQLVIDWKGTWNGLYDECCDATLLKIMEISLNSDGPGQPQELIVMDSDIRWQLVLAWLESKELDEAPKVSGEIDELEKFVKGEFVKLRETMARLLGQAFQTRCAEEESHVGGQSLELAKGAVGKITEAMLQAVLTTGLETSSSPLPDDKAKAAMAEVVENARQTQLTALRDVLAESARQLRQFFDEPPFAVIESIATAFLQGRKDIVKQAAERFFGT